MGLLTRQAVRGFQEAKGIKVTGRLNAETQAALGEQAEATETVKVTDVDAAGPFLANIPESMAERAKLDGLPYTSIEEALAEKYHTTPTKLRALNRGADFEPGSQTIVPAVRPAAMTGEGASGWDAVLVKLSVAKVQPSAAKVVVDKSDRNVRVFDSAGKLLAQFPATLGSEHDPLPLGQWKIRGVTRLPSFNYNPELFWDADAGDAKAKLPPGPNGPVGVVWIDLSRATTSSADRSLAMSVRPGTPIRRRRTSISRSSYSARKNSGGRAMPWTRTPLSRSRSILPSIRCDAAGQPLVLR
jgi:lipoprotein-anchoring transpeptidase ErfK/SrfK